MLSYSYARIFYSYYRSWTCRTFEFQFWIIKNNATTNIHVRVFLWTYICFNLTWVNTRNGMIRSYSRCMLNFLRNYQTFFQSSFSIECSHIQYIDISVVLYLFVICFIYIYVFNFSHLDVYSFLKD